MKGKQSLYFGDDNGKTFKFDDSVHSDNGNSIAMKIRTKYYSFDNLGRIDLLKKIRVFGEFPNGLIVSLSIRNRENKSKYIILKNILNEINEISVYEKGNSFSLRFDEYSSDKVEINGFLFDYKRTKEIYE